MFREWTCCETGHVTTGRPRVVRGSVGFGQWVCRVCDHASIYKKNCLVDISQLQFDVFAKWQYTGISLQVVYRTC